MYIEGEVHGKGPAAAVDLKIWAKDIPIDDRLRGALDPKYQKLLDSFAATGRVDIDATVRQAFGEDRLRNRYVAHVHDGTIRFDQFAYPIENIAGTIDIRSDHWEYREFRGTHKGGAFTSRSESAGIPQRAHSWSR